jgi:curved DNA-binding protein CbpA
MHTNKDLYQLLGLTKEASEEDIQRAHRKLVREYHPDANPAGPRAEERFKAVQQAYEVLSDGNKRREYNKRFHTSSIHTFSREGSGRPQAGGAGAKTGGDAAQGTNEQRAHQDRGPMFTLGYFLGIVLVALMVALLILLILDLD